MQLSQLILVNLSRRASHEAGSARRLGEGDDLADRIRAAEHGADAIEAERYAAMRRRARLERLKQEAEFGLRLVGAYLQRLEDPFLDVPPVDTDAASADLGAVEHYVISLRQYISGALLQKIDILPARCSEGMVHWFP